jgi:hypothetical protein
MALAFDLALLEVAYRGERGGECWRQRGREDEPGRVAAQEIDECRRTGDIAADQPKALPRVPWITVGRCMTPSRSAMPPPCVP